MGVPQFPQTLPADTVVGRLGIGPGPAQAIPLATAFAHGASITVTAAGIEFIADGGGQTLTTGLKAFLEVPFDATINSARLFANQSGSIVIDIWKCTFAQFDAGATHPAFVDRITAGTPPTITTATKSEDTVLTGWNKTLNVGDILGFNITSVTSIQRATLSLDLSRVSTFAATNFDTRVQAAATSILTTTNWLRTAGYSVIGDGGAALYKRVAVNPGAAGFQSLDGAWWELSEPIVSIEMTGGIGDGVTDSTAAFQDAMDSGADAIYVPGGIFCTSGSTIPTTTRRLYGPGTIKWIGTVNAPFLLPATESFESYGLTFDVSRAGAPPPVFSLVDFLGPIKNVSIHDNWFENCGLCAVFASLTNVASNNISIDNNTAENFNQGFALLTTGVADINVRRNRMIGDNTQTGTHVEITGTGRIDVSDNYFFKYTSFGVSLIDSGIGTTINRNVFVDGLLDTIELAATNADVSSFEICDNVIDNPTVAATDLGIGVGTGAAGRIIQNGTVKGNIIRKRYAPGIFIYSGGAGSITRYIEVSQNFLVDCNQHDDVGNKAIDLSILTATASVINNVVRDNTILSTDAKTRYGFGDFQGGGTADFNRYLNNTVIGAATGICNISGVNSLRLDALTEVGTITLVNGLNSNIAQPLNHATFLRVAGPGAAFSIGGLVGGFDGQRLVIHNPIAQNMTIVNEDALSTAINRITTLSGADVVLAGISAATVVYSVTDLRWILIATQP